MQKGGIYETIAIIGREEKISIDIIWGSGLKGDMGK